MSDNDASADIDEKVHLHQQCLSRLIYSSAITLVMVLSLIGLIAFLAYAVNKLELQQQDTAPHRLNTLDEQVGQALKTIKAEHRKHKDYLKKYHLQPLIERHSDFYLNVLASEKAYTDLIATYQNYIYDIAGRIRGTGEWHRFYTARLDMFQQRSLNRSRYLNNLKPAKPVPAEPEQP